MATNVTFSSLISDLQSYLERGGSQLTDPTVYNQFPRLINAAERDIAQMLKLLGQIEVLVSSSTGQGLQINNPVVTKPDRWRKTVSLTYGSGTGNNTRTILFGRSLEYCTTYWPNRTLTDAPLFYAEYDYSHWLVAPTPNANYPLEIVAYMQPRLLDDANQSNFFSEYTPNCLLYGALVQATPFLKDDPRIQTWKTMYEQQLSSLDGQDLQRILDRATERTVP
jgi:hypothetical protein